MTNKEKFYLNALSIMTLICIILFVLFLIAFLQAIHYYGEYKYQKSKAEKQPHAKYNLEGVYFDGICLYCQLNETVYSGINYIFTTKNGTCELRMIKDYQSQKIQENPEGRC